MYFFKKKDYNVKITETESKIPSISVFATNAALTPVENKISDVSNLFQKTDYDAEVLDVKSKYFTAANYNKFANEKLDLKIKQKGLVDKSDIARFINNFDFNKQVATLAT